MARGLSRAGEFTRHGWDKTVYGCSGQSCPSSSATFAVACTTLPIHRTAGLQFTAERREEARYSDVDESALVRGVSSRVDARWVSWSKCTE